jgi:hypothetical protein
MYNRNANTGNNKIDELRWSIWDKGNFCPVL